MKHGNFITGLCITLVVLAGILSGVALHKQPPSMQVTMALSVMAALFSLAVIPFFMTSVRHFKIELRHAYEWISYGTALFGVAQLQLPILTLVPWQPWINSGAIALPYLIGVAAIYRGMRILAKLFNIKGIVRSVWASVLASVCVSVISLFLPHVRITTSQSIYHLSIILTVVTTVFLTFASGMALQVKNRIGPLYVRSINWLYAAIAMLALAGWLHFISQLTFTTGDWYYDYKIGLIPFVFSGLLFVIAGLVFSRVGSLLSQNSDPNSLSRTTKVASVSPTLGLDMVLYVAGLASNPADVDPILDKVRMITSRLQAGDRPTEDDLKTFINVYKELETYLTQRDTLHLFTPDELHYTIIDRFGLATQAAASFWSGK